MNIDLYILSNQFKEPYIYQSFIIYYKLYERILKIHTKCINQKVIV